MHFIFNSSLMKTIIERYIFMHVYSFHVDTLKKYFLLLLYFFNL